MAKNTILKISLLLLFLYIAMAVMVPIEWVRLFAAAVMTAFAAAAAALWLPDAFRIARDGRLATDRVTLIAVALVTTGTAYIGAYSIIFNTLGRPTWLAELPVYALGQLLLAFGNFLFTASPTNPTPTFHNVNAWMIAGGVTIGAVVGFMLGIGVDTDLIW